MFVYCILTKLKLELIGIFDLNDIEVLVIYYRRFNYCMYLNYLKMYRVKNNNKNNINGRDLNYCNV